LYYLAREKSEGTISRLYKIAIASACILMCVIQTVQVGYIEVARGSPVVLMNYYDQLVSGVAALFNQCAFAELYLQTLIL